MHGMRGTRCYLLADSQLDLAAYRGLIESLLGHVVIGTGPLDPNQARRASQQAGVVLVVIADRCDAQAAAALDAAQEAEPAPPVLLISAPTGTPEAATWQGRRHDAYVSARDGVEQLRQALAQLAVRSLEVAEPASVQNAGDLGRPTLSPRERELLRHLAEGLTLRASAERMGLSYKTADSYRSNLMRKLGLHDRVSLVRWAIRHALVPA